LFVSLHVLPIEYNDAELIVPPGSPQVDVCCRALNVGRAAAATAAAADSDAEVGDALTAAASTVITAATAASGASVIAARGSAAAARAHPSVAKLAVHARVSMAISARTAVLLRAARAAGPANAGALGAPGFTAGPDSRAAWASASRAFVYSGASLTGAATSYDYPIAERIAALANIRSAATAVSDVIIGT
jgi:hypothetical protein